MNTIKSYIRLLILVTGMFSVTAQAVIIDYSLTQIDSDTYQYDYSITNNDVVDGIEGFSVWFDYGVTDNVTVSTAPTGWDTFVLPEDDFFGDGPIVDASVFDPIATPDAVIALGETQDGFSVVFDWLDSVSAPTEQYFDVYVPFPFAIVTDGFTTLAQTNNDPAPVPEPSLLLLLMLGLFGVAMTRKRQA